MRRIVLSILSFLLLIVVTDSSIGSLVEKVYHSSRYGIYHRQNYILNKLDEEIVILGSSRACHHYVPSIITKATGKSCYNAGSDGMCIYYHYAMLVSMIERGHIPKVVIYDMMDTDVSVSDGATFTLDAAIERLMPHYGELTILDSLVEMKGTMEHLKMKSMMYRYNSKLVQLIKCNYIPSKEDNGYEAVYGKLQVQERIENIINNIHLEADKVFYLEKFLTLCENNDIKLIMIRSPWFAHISSDSYNMMKMMAEEKGFVVWDMVNEEGMMEPELFKDSSHLNDKGARFFSCLVAKRLKELLEID